MNRSLFLAAAVVLVAACTSVYGQEEVVQSTQPDTLTWKKKLNFAINLNQASFSSNWKAGGLNSVGFNSLFNYLANYQDGRNTWDNNIDLAFGFVHNAGQGYRKTVDRIFLDTKYGYAIGEHLSLFSALSFLSQFAKGYQYTDDVGQLVSGAFAPAFITGAIGLQYEPVEYFKVRLSPFSPRITIVNDPERFVTTVGPEPYGVKPPDNVRWEWLGFQLLAQFNKELAENINLKWRYVGFANYETLELRRTDHRVDLDFMARIGKYFNVGVGGILIYDYDQDPGAQFSQVFSIGFVYSFQNYADK